MLIELILSTGYFIPIDANVGNCSRVVKELRAMGYHSSRTIMKDDRGIKLFKNYYLPISAVTYNYWSVKVMGYDFYCDDYSSDNDIAYRTASPSASKIVDKALERLNIPRSKY